MGDTNANGRHAKPRRRHRFVIAGLVIVLTATAVQVTRMAACADSTGPHAQETGQAARETGQAAYYHDLEHGNCSLDVRNELVVSVSTEEYAGSAACGGYLDVTGPRGTVRVQVVDRCPGCRRGDLDMSRTAFARIAAADTGTARVVYHLVRNPTMAEPIAFRIKQGATRFWFAVQVIDHGNPLRSVEAQQDGVWRPLVRGWDNYWVAGTGLGAGPFTVRVTDVYGDSVVAHDVLLQPGEVQRTVQRLYAPSAESAPVPEPVRAPVPPSATGGCS